MDDLVRETELNPRTIRYYITQGLLPPAHGRGPRATYDRGHLLRLLAIKRFREQALSLTEIKDLMADLTDEDLAAELDVTITSVEDRWRRIQLHPDIELHVRSSDDRARERSLAIAAEEIKQLAQIPIGRLGGSDRQ
jgi:DNA-binding transcriptional MerR regulator